MPEGWPCSSSPRMKEGLRQEFLFLCISSLPLFLLSSISLYPPPSPPQKIHLTIPAHLVHLSAFCSSATPFPFGCLNSIPWDCGTEIVHLNIITKVSFLVCLLLFFVSFFSTHNIWNSRTTAIQMLTASRDRPRPSDFEISVAGHYFPFLTI